MPLTTLTRSRTSLEAVAGFTTPADWITAIRNLVTADPNMEEKAVDSAGTKRWTLVGPVSGSPNINQRWLFYADSASAPAQRSSGTSGSTSDLYVGYAPTGGLVTFGNPVTDNPLFTGGTAAQRRYDGVDHYSRDADSGGGYSGFRLISSNEDLTLYGRGDTDEVYVYHGGAIIEPDGNNAESDGRIHGWFTESSGVVGSVPLQAGWLSDALANGKYFLRADDAGSDQARAKVFDPLSLTSVRTIRIISDRFNLTTRSALDDNDKALLQPMYYRFASGATSGMVGRLRQVYVWMNDMSMRQITSGGGSVTKGWTLGPTESTTNNCVLIGATI